MPLNVVRVSPSCSDHGKPLQISDPQDVCNYSSAPTRETNTSTSAPLETVSGRPSNLDMQTAYTGGNEQAGSRPCSVYRPDVSDRTSLMSDNMECVPSPLASPSSSPLPEPPLPEPPLPEPPLSEPPLPEPPLPEPPLPCLCDPLPPELCLSPLHEPLQASPPLPPPPPDMTDDPAILYHTSRPKPQETSIEMSSPRSKMQETSIEMSTPRPKPQETSIEMSTQTERDFSDYPMPLPLPPPPPPPAATRSDSRASLTSTAVGDCCRICHCESEPGAPLISPCVCCGSLKFVHQSCLQQWIKSADTKSCELCKFDFEMTTRIKPFRKWQKLEMTTVERRKVMCSVTFHIIAITCVIWSLYVLIDRTTEEIRMGILEWPFWTKLIVVAIGFTGGLVFMYVQCKMYVQLCRRWRAYNRVIFIQNCPNLTGQKIPLQPHMLDENGRQKAPSSHPVYPTMQETELL